MRRRHDDERPREERDLVLGKALDELDSPEYPPDFLASVWERVDAAEGTAVGGRLGGPRPLRFRRPAMAAAVAVGIAAAVLAAVLTGLPGVSRLTGPEPVSAAEVVQKALHALSSGRTIQADATEKYATALLSGPVAEYAVVRSRVLMRSDGSFRFTRTDPPDTSGTAMPDAYAPGPLPIDPNDFDAAYDAVNGVVRDYYLSSEWPGPRVDVTTGYALGPPDRWANFQADLSAVALALQAGHVGTLTTTTYDGRPAWVVSMSGSLALRRPGETYSITIDQKTCLPVRFQIAGSGVILLDYSWHNVRADEPLPETVFTFAPPGGVRVYRDDDGFRRVSIDRIDTAAGYVLLQPAWLPAGYEQTWVAIASRATTANGMTEGRHVVDVQYTRGFDALTVTTRVVSDARTAATVDPIEPDTVWAGIVAKDVRLTGGAFAGVTARVVVAPQTTIPHLYAVKDDVLLTVAGSATAKELIAIAESLQS